MANTKLYTLFGFCPELDWKPTAFVGPIPPSRVCSSCGRIPMSGLLLPCTDLMCLPCFESDESCPVHGIAFPEKELQRTTFPLRHMLQRKVYCWNSSRGCDVVGTLSFMLEHYEQNCPFGAAPTDAEGGPAELGERHSNRERLTVPGPEQRTQNALMEARGSSSRNESTLEYSDVATFDDSLVANSRTTSATSQLIALSTRAGGLREGVDSTVRIRVDTRSSRNSANRAQRGSRSTGTSRAQQQQAHEHTPRAFENLREHGRSIKPEPASFNQQTHVEKHPLRRSTSAATNNENAVLVAPRRKATSAAHSTPPQEGTSMLISTEAMEAASNGSKLLGDAKASGTTSGNRLYGPFLPSQLQETRHCEPPAALSIGRGSYGSFSETLMMKCCENTQLPGFGEGPSGTPVTALVSDYSGECQEASRENEPPADNSVTVHEHCADEGAHNPNKDTVSDSHSIAPGSSDGCEDPLEGTKSNDDAFSNTMHQQQTGYGERRSVHAAPSEGTKYTAVDDAKLQRAQDSEVSLRATRSTGSAQGRPIPTKEGASTRFSSEKVCEGTQRLLNVPSLRPAAVEQAFEPCETEGGRTKIEKLEAQVEQTKRVGGTNLPSSGSYPADDRNNSQLSNRGDEHEGVDNQHKRKENSLHQLTDEAFRKITRCYPQTATGCVGREQALLDSTSVTNSLNFPAIHCKINEAIEAVSKGKNVSRSVDAVANSSSNEDVIEEACQKSVYADAQSSRSSHTGFDHQVYLVREDRCPLGAAADGSETAQSDCPDDRHAEPAFGRPVTGQDGRSVPSDEATIEVVVKKEPCLSRASVFNVSPSSSGENVTRTSRKASFSRSFSRNVSCTEENRGIKRVVCKVVQSPQVVGCCVTFAPAAGLSLSEQMEETPTPAPFCTPSSEEATQKGTEQNSEDFAGASLIRSKPEEAASICQDTKFGRRVQENHQDSNLCCEISPLGESPSQYEKTGTEHVKVLISTKLALDAVLAATKESVGNHTRKTGALHELQEAIGRSTCDVINICKAMLHTYLGNWASFEWYVNKCDEVKNQAMQFECLSRESPSTHYFCGYHIKPSIFLRKKKDVIEIHPELVLYKGVYDDFIRWPFDGKCKLVIVHPCDGAEDVVLNIDDGDKRSVSLAFTKPKAIRNIAFYAQGYHSFQDVENRGFASGNKLRLRFEVLLPS